jgi:hypothetical protein
VFEDSKPISVLPVHGKVAGLTAGKLSVYDPDGAAAAWLDKHGQGYTKLDTLESMPESAQILLVGRNALSKELKETAAPAIDAFVAGGGIAIVLEQDEPLEQDELPVEGIIATAPRNRRDPGWMEFRRARGQDGAICFPVIGQHAIFADLAMEDFFTWAGANEDVYRKSYAAPSAGALPLAVAGGELALAPMLQISSGKGIYILSQMLIGERLGTEPAADKLVGNMLAWAVAQQSPVLKETAAYIGGDDTFGEFLISTGVKHAKIDSLAELLASEAGIKIVRAEGKAVGMLNENREAVRRYCEEGGWIILTGLNREGLDSFNELIGFEHRIRPFGIEATKLKALFEPLLLGVGTKDLSMYSDEQIAPWMGLYRVSDVVFTDVVDGENIASFAEGVNLQLANGLTTNNFWHYIYYLHDPTTARIDLPFDRRETLEKMNVWVNPSYYYIKDVDVVLDDKMDEAIAWTLEKSDAMQTLALGGRTASKVSILVRSVYPGESSQNIGGIDEIQLIRELPSDFEQRVVVLTQPGGLVKYPIGEGGILLNQLDYASEDLPENMQKKRRVYFNILNNMGASFKTAE